MGRGNGGKKMQKETSMFHNDERQQKRRARQIERLKNQKFKNYDKNMEVLHKYGLHEWFGEEDLTKMKPKEFEKILKDYRSGFTDEQWEEETVTNRWYGEGTTTRNGTTVPPLKRATNIARRNNAKKTETNERNTRRQKELDELWENTPRGGRGANFVREALKRGYTEDEIFQNKKRV